ncbi:hypothetical protein J6590_028475 [Homalodisca vitripennis]|nr:hypothetical protein J6590_028475 [Homalodisca vitripennis]
MTIIDCSEVTACILKSNPEGRGRELCSTDTDSRICLKSEVLGLRTYTQVVTGHKLHCVTSADSTIAFS